MLYNRLGLALHSSNLQNMLKDRSSFLEFNICYCKDKYKKKKKSTHPQNHRTGGSSKIRWSI